MVQPSSVYANNTLKPDTSIYAATTTPDLNTITIGVSTPYGTRYYERFLSYDYQEDYLSPSDSFNFSLDADELTDEDRAILVYRAQVSVYINGLAQTVGYIGPVDVDTTSGTIVTISGKDWLSPSVEGHIDPKTTFLPSMTLLDLVQTALGPFGVTDFLTDNIANRNSITGKIYGSPTSKKGKPLKSYGIHSLKPFQNEGAFAFASRIAQRFGLWIRPSNKQGTVILAAPDFEQPARYALVHKASGAISQTNNIASSHVRVDGTNQPSIIVANASLGGGEFSNSGKVAGIVNPLVQANLNAIFKAYPGLALVPLNIDELQPNGIQFIEPYARPLFLHDPESHTGEELNAFLRRQMSLSMRHAFSGRYTIMGHQLAGQPLAVDTIVSVDDDRSNIHQDMWILNRHFCKRAGSGTTTTVEVILPGALTF